MAERIDGKTIAAGVIEKVKAATQELQRTRGVVPGLAVVIVGDDAASHTYVAAKGKRAKDCGFHSVQITLEADTGQADLEKVVSELNADPAIHGILVQLPLPGHLEEFPVIQMIRPEKDVDGLSIINAGKLAVGDLKTGLISCTPAGAMILVRSIHGEDLSGLNAVVVGRSNLFGKPMGRLLLQANATVTMAHSRTADLASVCRSADILVAATGRAEMVKADWVKPGATIIDVGITRVPAPERGEGKTRLLGDVDFAACELVAGAISPVPGGVGPMTITMLMANTAIAAYRAAGLEAPRF
nr:bifunctional methylenetetrahydrofolate dehydrogenase/methenyltetrahydrofolate cyclohydrolase FolD [Marinicella sp. W31]MDC2878936.1 bifunctional methylenetetrahydrofolate dehydrogenase/methenyltetrahydrofolate cyclohydrolase FolD [Marinicella sp. W31]